MPVQWITKPSTLLVGWERSLGNNSLETTYILFELPYWAASDSECITSRATIHTVISFFTLVFYLSQIFLDNFLKKCMMSCKKWMQFSLVFWVLHSKFIIKFTPTLDYLTKNWASYVKLVRGRLRKNPLTLKILVRIYTWTYQLMRVMRENNTLWIFL